MLSIEDADCNRCCGMDWPSVDACIRGWRVDKVWNGQIDKRKRNKQLLISETHTQRFPDTLLVVISLPPTRLVVG